MAEPHLSNHAPRRKRGSPLPSDGTDRVRLWTLRLLTMSSGQGGFVREQDFSHDRLAQAIGLGHWLDNHDRAFEPRAVRSELRALHEAAEASAAQTGLPPELLDNVRKIADLTGIGPVDCRILELAVMVRVDQTLESACDLAGNLNARQLHQLLACLLDLDVREVRQALSVNSDLLSSGILALCAEAFPLSLKFIFLNDDFADALYGGPLNIDTLLRGIVTPAPQPQLSLADYAHLGAPLATLSAYLARALQTRRSGVNIFLHGPPGTGKTQLARVLAQALGFPLFEISGEDASGTPADGQIRLRAYRAAQMFFRRKPALLLFDEVGDVFGAGEAAPDEKRIAQSRKAWVNRSLEENPVPALWLANSIEALDAAFVRRFDMILELPIPPRRVRERIVHTACGDLLDAPGVQRMAQIEQLAPAVIHRAAAVVRCVRDGLDTETARHALEQLVGNTLEAQGHPRPDAGNASGLPDGYDPSLVNAGCDLERLADGLSGHHSARICLHGPPGTGKTAFGRWLAQRLGKPLDVRRASDLLSKYHGETEKNLARAFREAGQHGALLLLDEVDSYLRDRREAQRPWEVSEVNEMLTQMEQFSGLFIASTNLMQGLDPAALRRFDLKLRFGYLDARQSSRLLATQCATLGLRRPPRHIGAALARLDNLTPGDFAAVARRHRFQPLRNAAEFVEALLEECRLKENAPRAGIGFVG